MRVAAMRCWRPCLPIYLRLKSMPINRLLTRVTRLPSTGKLHWCSCWPGSYGRESRKPHMERHSGCYGIDSHLSAVELCDFHSLVRLFEYLGERRLKRVRIQDRFVSRCIDIEFSHREIDIDRFSAVPREDSTCAMIVAGCGKFRIERGCEESGHAGGSGISRCNNGFPAIIQRGDQRMQELRIEVRLIAYQEQHRLGQR